MTVDPLEILYVREVMRRMCWRCQLAVDWESAGFVAGRYRTSAEQRLLPVVDAEGRLVGVLTRGICGRRLLVEAKRLCGVCYAT